MQRLSGAYFYVMATEVEPLATLTAETTGMDGYGKLFAARQSLNTLLSQTLVRLRTSSEPCSALRDTLDEMMAHLIAPETDVNTPLGVAVVSGLRARLDYFRSTLMAELRVADFYAISPKGAYDTTKLAEEGITAFHPELIEKVPTTISDAMQAGRCIAFDLPTAAAFHLHRINEAVMRAYYDSVTMGKQRPEHRNIGAYIDAMKNHKVQEKLPSAKAVYAVLAMIKDHHRNPVLHPDDSLKDVEEALSLLGIIRTACGLMLEQIKPAALELTAPESQPVANMVVAPGSP